MTMQHTVTPSHTQEEASENEAVLDLLMETMDAWEAAITKRMHAAVASAAAAARRDVMQVRYAVVLLQSMPPFPHRARSCPFNLQPWPAHKQEAVAPGPCATAARPLEARSP